MNYSSASKRILLLISFCFVFTLVSAQYSAKYLSLVKDLVAVDSVQVTVHFKNGQPRESYQQLIYEINGDLYTVPYGEVKMYRRDGVLYLRQVYDRYGNELSRQFFGRGNIEYFKTEAEFIDTQAKTTEEVFSKRNTQIVTLLEKEYFFVKEDGEFKRKLWKEGKRRNKKKIGVWKMYDACGNLRKEKQYKN
jgi:hypothetical protein